jgi:hypothetical protein
MLSPARAKETRALASTVAPTGLDRPNYFSQGLTTLANNCPSRGYEERG